MILSPFSLIPQYFGGGGGLASIVGQFAYVGLGSLHAFFSSFELAGHFFLHCPLMHIWVGGQNTSEHF